MKENDGHCTRVGRGTNAYLQCMKPEGFIPERYSLFPYAVSDRACRGTKMGSGTKMGGSP